MKWIIYLLLNLLLIIKQLKLVFTFEVHTTDLQMGKYYSNISISQNCKEIHIPNRYAKIELNTQLVNVEKMLITDTKINASCAYENSVTSNSQNTINSCCALNNASICIEVKKPTYYDLKMEYCIESVFLYVCPIKEGKSWLDWFSTNKDSNQTNSFISVFAKVNSTQGCNSLEFSPYSSCASIGLDACRSHDKCKIDCSYFSCNKELPVDEDGNSNTKTIFSMCLPKSTSDDEVINRCKSHLEFKNTEPILDERICNPTSSNTQNQKNESQGNGFFKILCVIISMIGMFTFMASVYFRYKISNDSEQPFDVPNFCPNFIFPRLDRTL